MVVTKKSARQKKTAVSNLARESPSASTETKRAKWRIILIPFKGITRWSRGLQSRSPHRSFRRTRRRDYVRSLDMPGYVAFTVEVWRVLWAHKVTFGLLTGLYALLSGLAVGIASQSTYTQIGELLRTTSGDIFKGNIGRIGEAGTLLVTGISGGLNPNITEAQQLLAGLIVLLAWLTTVWLLRAFLAGQRPRLRDGLYNAGSPIIPTFLVSLLFIAQLIPAAIVAIGASVAVPTGLLDQGVEAMLFWTVAFLLLLLSLYWISGTLMALVVVTLPGMYPMQALRTAGNLVVGRRLRILLRFVWLLGVTLLLWLLVMIPAILSDAWLKGLIPAIQWLPIVPVGLLVMGAFSVVWVAAYVYLFYRKVVDDDIIPA